MASVGVPAVAAPPAGAQGVPAPPVAQKNELSPVLQQLSLESIRTRTQDLFHAVSRIIESFQTLPQHKWSEVLGQFSMVNVELLNLVGDMKPILKVFVVHPKTVNAENAPKLPIMLSSKLLPEMEAEEAALKEQILSGLSGLPVQVDKLQRQIEMVRAACEVAEKVLSDNRKLYGLGSRQAPANIPPLDKAQVAKIAEQEKFLRAAADYGEGLRLPPNEHQQPAALPPHLSQSLSNADGGSSTFQGVGFSKGISSTVSSMVATTAQLLGRSTPSPLPMLGGSSSLEGTSASPMPYASSPRSGNTVMNEASPQQQQQQQQALLQRQKMQQLQKMQQQQQQLRQPVTPPIAQSQLQQLQQQQQAQLQQHIQAQDRHQLQQMQLQQQTLQQQLQNNPLQPGKQLQQSMGQNQLAQANQVKPPLGQLASNPTSSLFGGAQSSMLSSNMYGVGMSAGGQAQRNLSSQMLADPMYNMGIGGSQSSSNVGLPLQQQLGGQSNFNSILNSNQNLNFGQQRQQPPS